MRNPFQAWPSAPPARVLIYGDPGTQKTRRALMQMPGPIAFVDLEVGATHYGAVAPAGSAYLATKSVADVRNAVAFLASPEGRAYRTVVIDPVTVIWAQLQEGHRARMVARGKAKSPEEALIDAGTWGRLNAAHGSLMTDILNLPQHVVLTARGKESTDDAGVATGYHMEGQKGVPFLVSTVIVSRTAGDVVLKDRSGRLREGAQPQRVDLSVLASTGGAVTRMETDDAAAERDARSEPDPDKQAKTPAPGTLTIEQRRARAVDALCRDGITREHLEARVSAPLDAWESVHLTQLGADLAALRKGTMAPAEYIALCAPPPEEPADLADAELSAEWGAAEDPAPQPTTTPAKGRKGAPV